MSFKLDKNYKIYLAGHDGMVGSAIMRLLQKEGFNNLGYKTLQELDLRNSQDVECFFQQEKPDVVILAAAKVGGINANRKYPADFLYDNLCIQNNLIRQAYLHGVKKFCFLGSSCIYPKECQQPMKEEYLLTGPPEPANEGYAIAKLAGYKLAYYYAIQYGMNTISPMPCNLYGQNDDFNLEKCHVMSALVKRFSDAADSAASEIKLWGTGVALREFMNVDDMAKAVLFLLQNHNDPELINVGIGKDISIKDLAEMISKKTGFKGAIIWDSSKPDGMLKKCLDVSRIKATGWKPKISLDQGIDMLINEYNSKKGSS